MSRWLARAVVRLSAWIAPRALRDRWREEWLAEIASMPGAPLRRALGAPIDALRAPRHLSFPGLLDLRLAVRTTLASPIVSLTSVLALGVGIALSTAAFTVVNTVVNGTLETPGGDQILTIRDYDRVGHWGLLVTLDEHERRRRALTSFIDVAGYRVRTDDITFEARHEIRRITAVTTNLFSVLGVNPINGRAFDVGDGEPGAAPVAVISEAIARAHGLAVDAVVGRRLDVRGQRYDVIGVIPSTCRFPFNTDIWLPLSRDRSPGDALEVSQVARARPDLDLQAATAELRVIAAQAPRDPREQRDQRIGPFARLVSGDLDEQAIAWSVVGGLVLLLVVAAANVANLMLARSAARRRDLAIRTALGASRGRVVAGIALEAALLAGVAAALGLAGARVALTIFRNLSGDLPYWITLDLDVPVFTFAVSVAALASLVAGVGPALKVTRGGLVDSLRTGDATLRFGRISAAITIVEAALAVGLLTGAASFAQALVGFGFQSYQLAEDRVGIAQIYFQTPADVVRETDEVKRRAQWRAFYRLIQQDQRDLASRLSALGGVRAVAFGWHFPGADRVNAPFELEGAPATSRPETRYAQAGAGYFALLGASVIAGRDFTDEDVDQERAVAIVNEPFTRKFFGAASPIGRRLRVGRGEGAQTWREIVGIVPDLGLNPGDRSLSDGVYVPVAPSNVVRMAWLADGNPMAIAPAVHEAVRLLPLQPRVQWSHTLADNLSDSASLFRALGWGLVVLGLVALTMTCTAIHAIVAFSLAQRRRELAVRLALGAGARGVVRALLGRTVRQLAAGAILGALLAVGINQLMDVLPMDVPRGGLWRSAAAMALIMMAGLSACAGPLRRALALKPVEWLRD
jgi:putative ABC transport system permease protein